MAGAVWFVIGTFYGLFSAIHLVAPEFFNNIPWLVFGRTRPAHVNTVIYGFVAGTLIGSGVYYTPGLLRTTLWSEPLGWISFVLWKLAVLSGPVGFAFGYQPGPGVCGVHLGRRMSWSWLAVLTMLVNAVMTILQRQISVLYISVWYFVGTFLWTAGSYPIGNVMWHPAHGSGERTAGFDLPVVLCSQPGGSDPDAAWPSAPPST